MNRAVDDTVISLYRQYSKELCPIPTAMNPSLKPLETVRMVLFDVYGTLVISSSGDVGTVMTDPSNVDFRQIFREQTGTEIPSTADIDSMVTAEIYKSHEKSRSRGIEYPEVEIRNIWKNLLTQLSHDSDFSVPSDNKTASKAALIYELSRNSVWPMPGASNIIRDLSAAHYSLGIISNAQFYTLQMMMHFFPDEFALIPEKNCIWSFMQGRGKPGKELFQKFFELNPNQKPESILYVGNDMLNDIYTASECGMKTALFAGDQRSLRLRNDDPRVKNIKPDVVLTSLDQLTTVLGKDSAGHASTG